MERPLTAASVAGAGGALLALIGAMVAVAPVLALAVLSGQAQSGSPSVLVAVDDRASVALAYRHSIWGVMVVERFEVTADGLRLVRVDSPAPQLDSYYHIPGARLVRQGNVYRLEVPRGPLLPEVRVRATEMGMRTLVVGPRCLLLRRVGPKVLIRPLRVPLWQVWRAGWGRGSGGLLERCTEEVVRPGGARSPDGTPAHTGR